MEIDKKELFEQYKNDLLNGKYIGVEIIIPKAEGESVVPCCHFKNTMDNDDDEASMFEYAILYSLLETIKNDIENKYPYINDVVDTIECGDTKRIDIDDEEEDDDLFHE